MLQSVAMKNRTHQSISLKLKEEREVFPLFQKNLLKNVIKNENKNNFKNLFVQISVTQKVEVSFFVLPILIVQFFSGSQRGYLSTLGCPEKALKSSANC